MKDSSRKDRYALRRDRLRALLRPWRPTSMLVTDPVHVSYLTGFTGEETLLLLKTEGESLISDFRFRQQLQEECPELDITIRSTATSLIEATAKIIRQHKLRRIGYESQSVSVWQLGQFSQALPKVEWISTEGLVEELRLVKDRSEITAIKRAIRIAERAFQSVRKWLKPDLTEREVASELEYRIRGLGGDGCSFSPIVAVGARGALPHAPPSDLRLQSAGFVLVDWGARGNGYVSDLTRMLPTTKISPKFRRIHQVVRRAQQAAIRRIRPGTSLAAVDAAARAVIEKAGHGRHFGHALGHGIGRQIHEAPRVGPRQGGTLQAGMVITIEPGIYLPGWGGVRIEDDVVVTKDGAQVLSQLSHELAPVFA